MNLIDTTITLKIINKLMTPFVETDAYKLGIIDEDGNNLIKSKNFTRIEQKNSYTYLDRLCFNIKKLINKLPGGESKSKNILSAYFLVKECYTNSLEPTESKLLEFYIQVTNNNLILEDLVANCTDNVSIPEKPIRTVIRRKSIKSK